MRTFLLFLLVLAPSVLLGQTVEDRFKNFINQHVKQGMNAKRCSAEMKDRKITETGSNECKDINTFINAGTNEIKKVCKEAGSPDKNNANLRASTQPFPVVKCKLKNNRLYPHCEYRGTSSTVYILIGCEGDYPVHYGGDVPNISG